MNAWEIHQRAIVLDAHIDSLAKRLERGDPPDLARPDARYQVDLPRLRQGGVTGFFCFVGALDLAQSLALWQALYRQIEAYPEDFMLARTAADIQAAKAAGRIAIVPQLESAVCLQQNLSLLSLMHRLGLRVVNLAHFDGQPGYEHSVQGEQAPFGYTDAASREAARREMKGLTSFGRELIAACNALGIIVDTAHANDAAFYEALALSQKPCLFSHGGVFALCPHWRCLTDDQIKALAAQGGVMGVAFYDKFIHLEAPSLARLLDQLEYVCALVGPDHVALGSDFDGLPDGAVPIPAHVGQLPAITEGLLARGFDEETIHKILGGNLLRLMAAVCG